VKVARTAADLHEALASERRAGRTVGYVPTMGALHEGHLSLVRRARGRDQVVVVSVFVNPLQFGPGEDFEAYPRSTADDLELLQAERADVAFLPSVEEMYPNGASTTVSVGPLGRVLEGEDRPGHFDGVCTVVAKLLHLVWPAHAFFGQKDAQQVAVVRRMVRDLRFPVEVVVGPTVREAGGLALSSRNSYLLPEDRDRATALWRSLQVGRDELCSSRSIDVVEKTMWSVLASTEGVEPSYARVVDPRTFASAARGRPLLLVVAARVGGVRLIDNLPVNAPQLQSAREPRARSERLAQAEGKA
jgi:pantoate--beta-alanine ligase